MDIVGHGAQWSYMPSRTAPSPTILTPLLLQLGMAQVGHQDCDWRSRRRGVGADSELYRVPTTKFGWQQRLCSAMCLSGWQQDTYILRQDRRGTARMVQTSAQACRPSQFTKWLRSDAKGVRHGRLRDSVPGQGQALQSGDDEHAMRACSCTFRADQTSLYLDTLTTCQSNLFPGRIPAHMLVGSLFLSPSEYVALSDSLRLSLWRSR